MTPDKAPSVDDLRTEVENLRYALGWALVYIQDDPPTDGEAREDYLGAQRLAWPDEPEQWDGE